MAPLAPVAESHKETSVNYGMWVGIGIVPSFCMVFLVLHCLPRGIGKPKPTVGTLSSIISLSVC